MERCIGAADGPCIISCNASTGVKFFCVARLCSDRWTGLSGLFWGRADWKTPCITRFNCFRGEKFPRVVVIQEKSRIGCRPVVGDEIDVETSLKPDKVELCVVLEAVEPFLLCLDSAVGGA